MNHLTQTDSLLTIDAWAEVPEDRSRDDFRTYLIELGNTVGEFNPDIGPRGAWHIGVFNEEK